MKRSSVDPDNISENDVGSAANKHPLIDPCLLLRRPSSPSNSEIDIAQSMPSIDSMMSIVPIFDRYLSGHPAAAN